jgi:hypothetical protein
MYRFLIMATLMSFSHLAAQGPLPQMGTPVPIPPPPPRPIPITPGPLTYTTPPPMPSPPLVTSAGPIVDGWGSTVNPAAEPGFYVDTEIAFLFPNLKFNVKNDIPLPITQWMLNVPSVDLNTTVSPTFELGYRLPEEGGCFALGYSFWATDGTGTPSIAGEPYQVRTRAALNEVYFDYGSAFELAPRYLLNWRLGAKITDVFFDSRATASIQNWTQQASSDFFGAGPHARLDLERQIGYIPGLALFGRVDGSVLFGRVKQRYRLEAPMTGIIDTATARDDQAVPTLNLQAGLSYQPRGIPGLKITLGYEYEKFFSVGDLNEVQGTGLDSNSRGSLWTHGAFLRGQLDF